MPMLANKVSLIIITSFLPCETETETPGYKIVVSKNLYSLMVGLVDSRSRVCLEIYINQSESFNYKLDSKLSFSLNDNLR